MIGRDRSVLRIERLERRTLLAADFGFVSVAGAGGQDKATDVAVDKAGNVYSVGLYDGPVDFDPSASKSVWLPGGGGDDAFVAKYSPAGALLWAVGFGGSGSQECQSVAIDPSGNVLVTGWFSSTVDFDPSPAVNYNLTSKGAEDAFVLKLTSQGQRVWVARLGGTGREGGISIATDSAGNVYSQGMFDASGDYDPGSETATLNAAGQHDVYISKLDPAGRFVYAKRFGGAGDEVANGLAVDASGSVLSMGSFSGTVDFDPGSGIDFKTSAGSTDLFVSKLSSAGSHVWCKRLGGAGSELGGDLAADASGNVYTTGSFSGTADFNPSGSATYLLSSSSGTADAFVSKLSSGGNFSWAKRIGGSSNRDKGNGIAVDVSGVYLTGKFAGSVDFNPSASASHTLSSYRGTQDIFAAKLTTGGSFVWARRLGGSSHSDEAEAIALGSNGAYLVGGFGATVDFDPGSGVQNRTADEPDSNAFLLNLIVA